jgi:hypothetical protein
MRETGTASTTGILITERMKAEHQKAMGDKGNGIDGIGSCRENEDRRHRRLLSLGGLAREEVGELGKAAGRL